MIETAKKAWSIVSRDLKLTLTGAALLATGAIGLALAWVPAGRATSDSAWYLDGARHLARGFGYTTAYVPIGATAPRAIAEFAPGFSALVGLGIRLGLDARRSAAVVLASSYVVYVAAAYLLALVAAGTRWWLVACALAGALAIHPRVLFALDTVGSDLPCAAIWIVAVALGVHQIQRRDPSTFAVMGIGVCLALAVFVRWAAMCLVVAFGVAWLVSLPEHVRIGRRLRLTACITAIVLGLISPWLIRNHLLAGTFTGGRRLLVGSPGAVATAAITGLTAAVIPVDAFSSAGDAWVGLYRLAIGSVVVAVFVVCCQAWRKRSVRFLLVATAGSVITTILSALVSPIDPLSATRYWLPVWPLVAALGIASLTRVERNLAARMVAGALALVVLVTAVRFADAFRRGLREATYGVGFLDRSWTESVAMRYALRECSDDRVLCNDPRVLLIQGGVRLISDLPDTSEKVLPLLAAPRVCIVYLTKPTTERIERQRPAQEQLLRTMAQRQLISRVQQDDVAEVWVSK